MNLFLLGSIGGDAVRVLYAWRAMGGSSGRIAISVLADRVMGLLGLMSIAFAFTVFNWHWMRGVPALATLGVSLYLAFGAGVFGIASLFIAPRVVERLERHLQRWPSLAGFVMRLHHLILLVSTKPLALLAAFLVSVAIQAISVAVVFAIGSAMKVGELSASSYMFAVPLSFVANALPLTPNGLGIGEAAFDQICRWLEPVPSGAAFSSIFFAFRAISALVSLSGLISFALYRNPPPHPAR